MEGLSMAEQVRPRIEQVEQGVQIIRHLQTHIAAVTHIAEVLAEDLPDDKRITLNRFRVQELVDILQLRKAVSIDDMSGRVYPSATGPGGQ